jgi:FdhD protein
VTGRTARRRVTRIMLEPGAGPGIARPAGRGQVTGRADLLAAEEPLGIRIGGQAASLTMRTPGDDIDLTAGFLLAEGIAAGPEDIAEIRICSGEQCGHAGHGDGAHGDGAHGDGAHGDGAGERIGNIADVTLRAGADWHAPHRNFLTTSACGVCGKASIDDLRTASRYDLRADEVRVSAAVLAGLPDQLRDAQHVFARTGGLHAAGLFTAEGSLLVVREDVGRHNAVDKVLGWALRAGRLPLSGCVLLVSGRASFELVQKAVMAGIPVLAAVSAPSSLAAELAAETGLTLVGFLRGRSMNVYAGAQRVVSA